MLQAHRHTFEPTRLGRTQDSENASAGHRDRQNRACRPSTADWTNLSGSRAFLGNRGGAAGSGAASSSLKPGLALQTAFENGVRSFERSRCTAQHQMPDQLLEQTRGTAWSGLWLRLQNGGVAA